MTNVRSLITRLAAQEARLCQTTFLAPCVQGGSVRARVEGLLYTFHPVPTDFEGWGLFRPVDAAYARVLAEADFQHVEAYLQRLPLLRMRLAFPVRHRTWLALPANASDARQRLGAARPVAVHLIDGGHTFEQILARWDGVAWWFEALDRRADPRCADALREALRQDTEPEVVRYTGLTPEMRMAYQLTFRRTKASRAQRRRDRDAERLQDALAFGGGQLHDFQDRGDYWLVAWSTSDGEAHRSAIQKHDLTVASAGICLSDLDADFDLQSLVGIIEHRPDWMRE